MTLNKILIAEGPDGAGKTTFLQWLLAQMQDKVHLVKTTRKPNSSDRTLDLSFDDMLIAYESHSRLLLDRHVQSDIVYEGFRGNLQNVEKAKARLDFLCSNADVYELYMLPDISAIFTDYADDLIKFTSEEYANIYIRYMQLAEERFCLNPANVLIASGSRRFDKTNYADFLAKFLA